MKTKNKFNFSLTFFSISAGTFLFFFYCLNVLHDQFVANCVNQEFLTWDPELRFILTLRMMNFLRNGEILSYLGQVLDSPHWPSLRNVFESLLFFITKPTPYAEIMISFATYALLPIGLLFVIWKEKISNVYSGFLFFLGTIILLQAEPLQLYSFTGMIEVQGALVFTFAAYFIGKFYKSVPYPEDKSIGWKVFLFTTLLYHSKYPYGYMLILSLGFLHLSLYPLESYDFAKRYLLKRKMNWYKNPRLVLITICILGLFLPKSILIGKIPNYLRYLIAVLFSLDLFLYFNKLEIRRYNIRILFLLKWIIFPILLWMLIQPDRFGSYTGQITHVEAQGFNPGQAIEKDLDYYLLFVTEFLLNGFQSFSLSYLIFFSNLTISIIGYYRYLKTKTITLSFIFSALSILTFLELSLFTTNRLARHTYHLYPVMILGLLIYINEIYQKKKYISLLMGVFITPLICLPFLLKPVKLLEKTELCYTGKDQNDYLTPKEIEKETLKLLDKPTIIFNEVNPYHVNKADSEYLISRIAYDRKISVLFDPKRIKKINPEYQSIWVIGDICKNSNRLDEKKDFWKNAGFNLDNPRKITGENSCIFIYPRE